MKVEEIAKKLKNKYPNMTIITGDELIKTRLVKEKKNNENNCCN